MKITSKSANKKTSELVIGVFNHGSDDIFKINLKWLNLIFYKVDSKQFEKMVDKFTYTFLEGEDNQYKPSFRDTIYYDLQNKHSGGFSPDLYALVPIDFTTPVLADVFYKIQTLLLILFPCDFQLEALVHYDDQGQGKFSESHTITYDLVSYSFIKGGYKIDLKIDDSVVRTVNRFLPKGYQFLLDNLDFDIAIGSYLEGFRQHNAKLSYICYCIALESLAETADGEITYKLSRTTAILNSPSKELGEVIFFNTKQFYRLRSTIVHGSKSNQLRDYFFPLQALVSRTLIEIIHQNTRDVKALSTFVHQSGFGEKLKTKGYKPLVINSEIERLVYTQVSKFKAAK